VEEGSGVFLKGVAAGGFVGQVFSATRDDSSVF
jgi:hypothetical protein